MKTIVARLLQATLIFILSTGLHFAALLAVSFGLAGGSAVQERALYTVGISFAVAVIWQIVHLYNRLGEVAK